jgi:hypothetical protein
MNRCFYSSFIFLINSIECSLCKEYYYSFTFKVMFLTSILFHSTQSIIMFYMDQLAVIQVALYGFYKIYKNIKFNSILLGIALCFIVSIVLFYYGYLFKCFCYDSIYSDYYHSLLHYISFIGNSLILIL